VLISVVSLAIAAGVGNNLTFAAMGQYSMPAFFAFLSYGPNVIYCILFGIMTVVEHHLGWTDGGVAWLASRCTRRAAPAPGAAAAPTATTSGASGAQGTSSTSVLPVSSTGARAAPVMDARQEAQDVEPAAWTSSLAVLLRPAGSATTSSRTAFAWFALLGLVTAVNGALSQYSDPFVAGEIQSVLGIVTLPATAVLVVLTFHRNALARLLCGDCAAADGALAGKALGVVLAIIGVVLNVISQGVGSSSSASSAWAVAFFAVSVFAQSVVDVIQEHVYPVDSGLGLKIWESMYWLNVVTLVIYVALAPLELFLPGSGVATPADDPAHQLQALQCLAGNHDNVAGCNGSTAALWVVGFAMCYVAYFVLQAILINLYGAVYQAVVVAIVTPTSTLAFFIPTVYWAPATANALVVVSIVVVVAASILYRADLRGCSRRQPPVAHGFVELDAALLPKV
jgi:hypothetical protein